MLVVGAKSILLSVEHKSLGKHLVTALPSVVHEAGALTYNSRNHSIFISDLSNGNIVELNLHSSQSKVLPIKGLEKVVSMDYGEFQLLLIIIEKVVKCLNFCLIYGNLKKHLEELTDVLQYAMTNTETIFSVKSKMVSIY